MLAMHARGVAHGDVRQANLCYDASAGRALCYDASAGRALCYDASAGRALCYDFSHSIARPGGGGDFEEECDTADMRRAEQLIQQARARESAPRARGRAVRVRLGIPGSRCWRGAAARPAAPLQPQEERCGRGDLASIPLLARAACACGLCSMKL